MGGNATDTPRRGGVTTISGPTTAQARWRASLCGRVTLSTADGRTQVVPGAQAQLVLAFLLLESRPVQRDELADLLWDGPLPDHWAGAVRGLVAKVRAALVQVDLPEGCLTTERGILRLDQPAGLVVDVAEAASLVERAGVALSRHEPEQAVMLARLATPTLRSLFLPRNDGSWVRHTRDRLDDLAHLAAHREIEGHLALGDTGAAIQRAEDALTDDTLDETAHHLLLTALIEQGAQVRALEAYERLRRQLATEHGIRPAEATEALYRRLVADGPARPEAPSRTAVATRGADRAVPGGAPDGGRREAPATSGPRLRAVPDAAGPHGGPFVGRAHELAVLEAAQAGATATARPHVVVIAGEAGIGKTRLALEFARLGARDHDPLWGRCRVDAGLPYEPIAEALLERLAADDGESLHRAGSAATGLFHLLPELVPQAEATGSRSPSPDAGVVGTTDTVPTPRTTGTSGPSDSAVARAHLFRSVAAVLAEVCAEPTLWVIDDLQWASQDTLTLLEFIVDELAAPLLLVVTARETSPEIEGLLARLQRRVPVDTITLDGLAADELAPLVTDLARDAGQDPQTVARTIAFRTGGNPFFIHEIAKDAARPGTIADPLGVPTAVRDWIERRAASLPPEAAAVLDLASVIGLDLDFDVLVACSPLDEAALLDRCDELVAAGLLAEIGAGRFTFPHAITRDAMYERQRATRRTLLHRHVGQALTALGPASGRDSLLAHHFARAGASFRADAFTHSMAAGLESLDQAAWSLAAEQLQAAVDLAGDVGGVGSVIGGGDDAARARALAHLGRARHGAGDADGARRVLEVAISIAREAKLPTELATAVLFLVGGGGRGVALGLPDAERAALIQEALDGLADGPIELGDSHDLDDGLDGAHHELAGALEGELALALLLTDRVDDREALARRSLARARQRPPGPALAQALLNVRLAKLGPRDVEARLSDGGELLALAPAHRSPEQTLAALVNRHEDLLLVGDRAAAQGALDHAIALADQYAHPYWRWVCATWTTLGAIIDGRLDEAEMLAFEATTRQVGDHPEALACLGVNLIDIRLYQGRAGELLELIAEAADANPHIPCYRAVLAMCAAESGDLDQARRAYAHFACDHFTTIPADTNRLLTLGVLAHTAVALDDRAAAPRLDELLGPYAGQQILLNCFGGGGSYWGPVSHQLARLAMLDGRDADAEGLVTQAAASATTFGAPLAAQRIADDRSRWS